MNGDGAIDRAILPRSFSVLTGQEKGGNQPPFTTEARFLGRNGQGQTRGPWWTSAPLGIK